MKILNGKELAGYIKERQARLSGGLRAEKKRAKLLIIRDSDNPVIVKYVNLKCEYGEDIGVLVEDCLAETEEELRAAILRGNSDPEISGIIVQLPLKNKDATDELLKLIAPEKDVDGLSGNGRYDSATATAINWLLAGYNIELQEKKIAIVGRGRLVGAPLIKMYTNSNFDLKVFHRGDNLEELRNFDIIITATGVPHLIKSEFVKSGAVVVDAGTASEGGVLVGDVDESVRERKDLAAITPEIGGVGPLTVGVLFENVLNAAAR